jgi:hypothetical protein
MNVETRDDQISRDRQQRNDTSEHPGAGSRMVLSAQQIQI